MRVRRATAADAEAFVRVLATVAEEGRWIGTEPGFDVVERTARVRASIEAGEERWLLEDDDGEVIGNLGLHPTHARGVYTLGMSIVAPARGRGGGRMLMDAVLRHLATIDAHKVELEVWPDNGRAISLYASCGFEVEGLRRSHYRRRDGSLRSSLIMARLLPRAEAEAQSRPGAGT
ncbi:MAG TPA: GNAT family N-acetyltransferase [Solirubrobacteraceae bacterium]|nr:GNAT family N-acetyltransferase [Solirubrobacteraceae bacterium]